MVNYDCTFKQFSDLKMSRNFYWDLNLHFEYFCI